MQNPSHGVAQPLQNHVHLISGHRFPLIAALSLDQAFSYLLDAPTIVKQIAAMSWTYVQAPPDGTIWLEWLPPEKMGADGRYPSDGYVWADQESAYRQEYRGYTIEIMSHTLGFRWGFDQMASHARTRYHLVAKNPSVNAAPPDPSLWIVHYHQADQNRMLPATQIPLLPAMQQITNERRWLESQGKLEKKDFMLHDRGSWPIIQVPSHANMQARHMMHPQQQAGLYNQAMPQNRFPQYFPQRQPGGPGQPPPKRQRPNQPIGGPTEVHDTTIEDEENTTHGDFFDHLTPRDISMARYAQHHRWMEEVFSSPYSSGQIVPTDLGLGLMGELRWLTDGILEPPSMDFSTGPKPPKPKEAEPFTNLSKEKIEEFNRRVSKYLEDGQAEIERMKRDHAAKMAEWKKTKTLMHAEKRLRYANWEGHEAAVPIYRLEDPITLAAPPECAKRETVEDIVKEIEGVLRVKISSHKEINMVEKGGLEEQEEPPNMSQGTLELLDQQKTGLGEQAQRQIRNGTHEGMAQTYHSDSVPNEVKPSVSQSVSQATHQQQQVPVARAGLQQPPTSVVQLGLGGPSTVDGMDVDIDNTDFNFDEDPLGLGDVNATGLAGRSTGLGAQAPTAPQQSATTSAAQRSHADAPQAHNLSSFAGSSGSLPPSDSQQQQPVSTTTARSAVAETRIGFNHADVSIAESAAAAENGHDSGTGDMDNSIFNDDTFDDLTNMDDAGDVDFGGDDGGMDLPSAFDEAMPEMDTPAGEENGQ
ncbi:MAG: hypothetical protein FE78DRAFT_540696 [Acidomyces sp. 'richmondensis']|nr:MAG: hypothetical protein FE78DRAFT_540696 [Acidomyces sp. 'richmondensis']